ncbi:MAG: cyclic nucleotide-binding domain-containing protein, partial [Bacteroidales bacterium]|nr:cyclic nucleotide-binding domain-containing protein [Bacteroidales bacterium]
MDRNEVSRFLKGVELFRNLTDKELDELAEYISEKRCIPGDILFSENSPREDIFVIYEGEVELFKMNPYGLEVRLALFG